MTTRLALILALLLLALAVVQWRLRSITDGEAPDPAPVMQDSVEGFAEDQAEPLEAIEEPELDIPEYIPAEITERPRPPMGFAVDRMEIEIAAPQISGSIDETPVETKPD